MWSVNRAILIGVLPALIQFISQHAFGKKINSFAGPYIVYTDNFYMCDKTVNWTWGLKTTHFNPTKPMEIQRITGWVNATGTVLSDSAWLNIIMDVRSNNMWKENAFVFKFPNGACSTLKKQIPEFYYVVLQQDRKSKDCCVQPRLMEVTNEPIAWLFPQVPIMPYGFYRFRLKAGAAGLGPAACFVVECHVVPKL